jgi:hypothetical protein
MFLGGVRSVLGARLLVASSEGLQIANVFSVIRLVQQVHGLAVLQLSVIEEF